MLWCCCVFVGVTAAVLFSTPSVDRKLSRVLAVFAENSTTRGHPPSGHLMTTAPAAFTCPSKTPETHKHGFSWGCCQAMTLDKVPVCLICVFPGQILSQLTRGRAQSVWYIFRFVFVCSPANTHTCAEPSLCYCKEQGENRLKNCCTRLYRLKYLYFIVRHLHLKSSSAIVTPTPHHYFHLFLKHVKSHLITWRNSNW